MEQIKNPFEFAEQAEVAEYRHTHRDLRENFSLDDLTAKAVHISNPFYQERLCRARIQASKKRGASGEGMRLWLKRRFNLSDDAAEKLKTEFWNEDIPCQYFLSQMGWAETQEQLTKNARAAIKNLNTKWQHF